MIDKETFYDIADTAKSDTADNKAEPDVKPELSLTSTQYQGDNIMAEVDTNILSEQHSDIRRDGMKNSFDIRGDVKDGNHDVENTVENVADRLSNQASQYYIAGQTADNIAQRDLATLTTLTGASARDTQGIIQQAISANGAAITLESSKVAAAIALEQYNLSKELAAQNEKTRDLINDHKYHDLSRTLVERNAELVDCRDRRDYWQNQAGQNQFNAQFAQLTSMVQNLNSQVAETRQGMVNFGSMTGVGQTSTSNNVR